AGYGHITYAEAVRTNGCNDGRSGHPGSVGRRGVAAAERVVDSPRRPGIWRPLMPRQSILADSKPGPPRRREHRNDAVLWVSALRTGPGERDDRPIQLSNRRATHVPGRSADGHQRSDHGRNVSRCRLRHWNIWQMAPG